MTTSENIIIDRNTPLDVLQQEAKKGNGWLGKGTAMVGCGTFSKVKIRPYTEEEKKQFGEKIMPYTEEEATKIIEIMQRVKQKRELSDMRKKADQKRN